MLSGNWRRSCLLQRRSSCWRHTIQVVLLPWAFAVGVSAVIHGEMMDKKPPPTESERVAAFSREHGTWPDPRWLAREPPAYTARMIEREKNISSQDPEACWNEWMLIAQARLMPNFTSELWKTVRAPVEVHRRLLDNLRRELPSAIVEEDGVNTGVHGPLPAKLIHQPELNYQILDELLPMHEAWAGVPLEATSAFGVRLYTNGSTMEDHLDVLESHVVSSILHIDADVDEPFPIEIEGFEGRFESVVLKPGDMMFYESAKCFHKRSVPMKGRYYGSLFLHYRPKMWNFTREMVLNAIPPYWRSGLDSSPLRKSPLSPQPHRNVIFRLGGGATQAADLMWLNDADGSELHLGTLLPGETSAWDTAVGHTWIVREKRVGPATRNVPAKELGRWTIGPDTGTIDVPARVGNDEL
eukprot:TRINITY_DN76532_c0_g1_i1.p1 TRINITY_DN76532_c0_g1~~TRINITY_DN76532_c0_g1_i1.p1  ORF type:complete len:432 (+),score=45.80 TRINITY_DN76532_c0_g1_i1:62-1297(+)